MLYTQVYKIGNYCKVMPFELCSQPREGWQIYYDKSARVDPLEEGDEVLVLHAEV